MLSHLVNRARDFVIILAQWATEAVCVTTVLPSVIAAAKLSTLWWKFKKQKPRIVWGPTPILTIATNSRAEKRLGYKSETLVYQPYHLTSDFDYNLERLYSVQLFKLVLPWLALFWAMVRYDIFHFFFDRGFLPPKKRRGIHRLELPILKLAGKRIIVSAYGGDVRYEKKCRSAGKYNCCTDCDQKMIACICDEEQALANVSYVSRYADVMLSMGDMLEYVKGSRNDVFYWSIDLDKTKYVGVKSTNQPQVIVVHAANHRVFKGTRYLVSVVERLKEKGYPIDLRLVEGLNNEHAREIYKTADVVAEQFLIGWHGYFAVEAMALGKPVVCFLRKPEEYLPAWVECPIINADPDSLEERLRWLIENPSARVQLGKEGRTYVEQVFGMDRVGNRLDRIYRGF